MVWQNWVLNKVVDLPVWPNWLRCNLPAVMIAGSSPASGFLLFLNEIASVFFSFCKQIIIT